MEEPKLKISKDEEKEGKAVESYIQETHYESFSRNSRTKFLTAKDGRGKILIGEDYQANMPNFM